MKEWIHTPIEDEAAFNAKVKILCDVYRSAPDLHKAGIHLVSCDEKTGMQALERKITPMASGRCERQDSSYERHGTQCLIANFEVATGKVISPSIGNTRTESDFMMHIKNTVAVDPGAQWIFVVDQLNTHKSASLVRFVAQACCIDVELGKKGKSGILKNMKTRAAFLSEQSHKIRFVYTPKHASWLNQVEVWFSILSRNLLKRLSCQSTEILKSKVLSFIEYFNKTTAKAFEWTYGGRPLKSN